jgi:PAS domain S-box-containing protein
MTFSPPNLNFLSNDSNYRRFVGYLHLALVVAAFIVMTEILLKNPADYPRVSLVAVYLFVLLISRIQLKLSGPANAIKVMVIGLWLTNAGAILMFSGIYSSNMLIFPFLITLSGWVMGRQWLLSIIIATVLFSLGVGLAEYWGHFQATPRSGPITSTVIKVTTLILFGLLTLITFEAFTRSRDTAVTLSEELSQHYIGLAQREREVNLIIDNIGAALAAFGTDSRLRMANRRYAAMFGSRPEDLVGRAVQDFLPKSVFEIFQPSWDQCLKDGKFHSYRRKHLHPVTGVETVVDVELTPDINDGKMEGLFVLIIDVTEKVRAEERIRELNETLEKRVEERTAELANAMERLKQSTEELAKSEAKATIAALVASVAHELGTPIGNGVMTASSINSEAMKFLDDMSSGQVKRNDMNQFLDSLKLSTELMLRNLARAEELLTNFKQVSADQASEQRRLFDLAAAVKEIMTTLTPMMKRKPHKVEVSIPSGIQMDSLPGPLGQIVINLINNAYLHAFDGREHGLLKISAWREGDFVTLTFADDGVGIPAEHLEKLFQAFFSTKIGKGGTGLGMTIVETLVTKSLGGTLAVTSTVGVGTTFTIKLPLILPEIEPQQPPKKRRRNSDPV